MTVFIVVSYETHFTAVVSGVQTNVRLEAAFLMPEDAEEDKIERARANPKASYSIERVEVR